MLSNTAAASVASIELVAVADEIESWLVDQVVEKAKIEVTRNGEDVGDIDLNQSASTRAA